MNDRSTPKSRVQSWIDRVVIGENMCPFAREAESNTHLIVSELPQLDTHIEEAITQVTHSESPINNVLVIIPSGLEDFNDFWAVCETLEANLERSGLLSVVQLAHFHPHYLFDELEPSDRANWTNRSPLPVLHFLCAQSVENSVHNFRDASSIPQRNIRHLQQLSEPDFQKRFNHES